MAEPSEEKLDRLHYHEALDRSCFLLTIVDKVLVDHPVVQQHEQIRERVERISNELAELYSELGQLSFEHDE